MSNRSRARKNRVTNRTILKDAGITILNMSGARACIDGAELKHIRPFNKSKIIMKIPKCRFPEIVKVFCEELEK